MACALTLPCTTPRPEPVRGETIYRKHSNTSIHLIVITDDIEKPFAAMEFIAVAGSVKVDFMLCICLLIEIYWMVQSALKRVWLHGYKRSNANVSSPSSQQHRVHSRTFLSSKCVQRLRYCHYKISALLNLIYEDCAQIKVRQIRNNALPTH